MRPSMKNFIVIFSVFLLFPSGGYCEVPAAASSPATAADEALALEQEPLTLDECYGLALRQSELIAIDAEKIKEAEARFMAAFEGLLPEVSFQRRDFRQNSVISPASNHGFDQGFVFNQALFTGFKEFAGMASGHYETKQRRYEKTRAEQLLFQDVSNAFYLLVQYRQDLKVLAMIKRSWEDRIKELNARVDIGKSRVSEVVFTESQLYNLDSTIELVKGQEQVARELLEFLVGRHVYGLLDDEIKYGLKSQQEYLAEAYLRPDVKAAKYAWESDKKQIMVAQSGFLPQLSFQGDRWGHRSSSPKDISWDAMLTLDIPVFEGNASFGEVEQAVVVAKQSELLFRRTKREAVREIHDAYVNMQSGLAVYMALQKALQSAQRNYELQLKDYRQNIVNNLDVLTAIQNLGNVERAYVQATYATKRYYWQLLVAAGEIGREGK